MAAQNAELYIFVILLPPIILKIIRLIVIELLLEQYRYDRLGYFVFGLKHYAYKIVFVYIAKPQAPIGQFTGGTPYLSI